jgi:hypothetical protein
LLWTNARSECTNVPHSPAMTEFRIRIRFVMRAVFVAVACAA